jgi:glutamate:GABA antiporter
MALFYIPSAVVVIHLNRIMPLEGGLYQWAKLGFNEVTGFLVAWNLWLFAILNTSETGLQITQYAPYILGPGVEPWTGNPWVIMLVSAATFGGLVWLAIRGLSLGKWVHKSGGALLIITFALLIAVPWLNVAKGALPEFHPLATAAPVVSLMSLNLLGKMGFGALGGFEYVAIHAGECRSPARTIAGSVVIATPIIAIMFIFGTSSVLALVPQDRIDLIAPIPQVLSIGYSALGFTMPIAAVTIVVLAAVRVAQASVMFTGNTRLPMVAGWDGILPGWFTQLHPRYQTPANSVLFVGAITFAFSVIALIGVGKQEAFQLLWNGSAVFYALTYLVMFALPIAGLPGQPPVPLWVKAAAVSGWLMTLLYIVMAVVPIVQVESRLFFALKLSTIVAATNVAGYAIFRRSRSRREPRPLA